VKILLKSGDGIDGSSTSGVGGRGSVRESKRKRTVAKDATADGDGDSDDNYSSDSEDSHVVNEKKSVPKTNKRSKLKSDPTTSTWKGRRKLKTLGECKRSDSEDSIVITWEHVLHAIQTHSKDLEAKKETKLLVHNDLPELELTPSVVYRTQQRLLKLYRNI